MNYLRKDLKGKTVLVNEKNFDEKYHKDISEGFMCEDGNGCFQGTFGEKIYGYWVSTKEKDVISGRDVVKEKATSPEVA